MSVVGDAAGRRGPHIGRDMAPWFRKVEKALLLLRYGLKFPPRHGAWPKYEYLKPWLARRKPAVVVDVGVNTGQVFHLAHRLFPEAVLVGVEPLTELHLRLKGIYDGDERVRLHNCACGSADGETDFYVASDTQNSSTRAPTQDFYVERPHQRVVERRRVARRRLDALLEGLPGPMFVKIDVQGGEMDVLEGLDRALDRVDLIVIEAPFERAYDGAATFDDLYRYLTARGFEYRGALGQLTSPRTGEVRQEDSIYVRR